MKNIFKSIMMLLSGAVLFASCLKEAAPLASEISVNKQEVTFTGYAGSSAQIQKVQVTSNGDWFITCNEDWVTVNPSFGSAGMTKVEITVTDNVDSYNELNGPRSAVVNFCYGETGVAPLTVKQTGETGLDASRTYRKVTSQDQVVAGGYLVVFEYTKDGAAKTIALDPLSSATEDTYKYAYGSDVVIADDAITMPNANNAWILEAAEGGYLLQTAGKYLFQDGNSFRATTNKEKAHLWTVTIEENGEATIKNISFENRWIQFSVGYGSAGCYASAQENAVMPTLYVDSVPPTDEVLDVKDVTVPAFATSAKIKVQSNRSWSVRCHDEWIKSFTKTGKNNGEIEVTFDEYTSTTEDRTATFQVISEGTNTVITFTQAKVAPTMTVEEFLAEGVAKGDYAILTGSIENIKNTNYGNFDLQDATGTVYIYGLYDVNGAKVFTDLGLKEGDIVTLYGPKDVYNNNPQVKSAIYVSHESSKIRRKLAFSAETAEAKLGNSFTAPTLSGDATDVEYTSSDVEVATVDAATGEVTLLAEGTTTITANGPETETHLAGTASYTLTVTAKTPRALAFSAAAAEATLGEEFTAPTLNGETAGVVYSSSDEEVATVDPATGAVTLVAAGETTITATAEADENFLAGTASYTLTVAEPGPTGIASIKELATDAGASFATELKDAVVTYVNGSNAYIQDEEAGILVYLSGHGLTAGDLLNGEVSGTVKLFNNLREITAIDLSKVVKTTGATIPVTELTLAEVNAAGGYDKYENMRVQIKDAEVTADKVISQNGQSVALYYKKTPLTGYDIYNRINVVGYLGKYRETVQLNVWENAEFLGATKTVFSGFGDVEVAVGQAVANKATASSGATVTYTSASSSIATVDQNGNVTGVAEGTTTITAKVDAYNGYPAAEATCNVTVLAAGTVVEKAWTLVTGASVLNVGDKIIIAAKNDNLAMSTTQNTNNRGQVAVTKSGNTLTFTTAVQEIILEAGTKTGTFAFNVGSSQYLYAASTSSNHLKTGSKNDNASWKVEIASTGVATIKSQGTNTKNWMRHNNTNGLFACYASGQNDICIYRYQ